MESSWSPNLNSAFLVYLFFCACVYLSKCRDLRVNVQRGFFFFDKCLDMELQIKCKLVSFQGTHKQSIRKIIEETIQIASQQILCLNSFTSFHTS